MHDDTKRDVPTVKFKDNKFVQLAMVSAQKYFLFLGDLSRYKEANKSNGNLGSAKEYYLKAQRLIPSNGVPYNQLAFVALHSVSLNCQNDQRLEWNFNFNFLRKINSLPFTTTYAV